MVSILALNNGAELCRSILALAIASAEKKIDLKDIADRSRVDPRISAEIYKFAQIMFNEGVKHQRETSK